MSCRSICIFIVLLWFILHVTQVHILASYFADKKSKGYFCWVLLLLSVQLYMYVFWLWSLENWHQKISFFFPYSMLWFFTAMTTPPHPDTLGEDTAVWSIRDQGVNYFLPITVWFFSTEILLAVFNWHMQQSWFSAASHFIGRLLVSYFKINKTIH